MRRGQHPSKMEKEIARWVRAGNVEAPATLGSFVPIVWKENKGMMVVHLDWLEPFQRTTQMSSLEGAVGVTGEKSP
jgi:hypothetical protein